MSAILPVGSQYYYEQYQSTLGEAGSWEDSGSPPMPGDEFIPSDPEDSGLYLEDPGSIGVDLELAELPEAPGEENLSELRAQIQGLLQELSQGAELCPAKREEFKARLEKLLDQLDLHPGEEGDGAMELEELRQEMKEWSGFPEAVQVLAQNSGTAPEEVAESFRREGLEGGNLPAIPDSALLGVLEEYDPSLREAAEKLRQAHEEKGNRDKEMVEKCRARNAQAVLSKRDLDDPDLSAYEYLWQAQNGEDPASHSLRDALEDFRREFSLALGKFYPNGVPALSEDALWDSAGLEPPQPPDLVPLAIDGRGRGRYDNLALPTWVQEYPLLEYDGDYRPR